MICRAASEPGGQIVLAARATWRKDLLGVAQWLASEVERLGVTLHLNRYAEVQDVLDERPDIVVVATGGVPNTEWVDGGEEGSASPCVFEPACSVGAGLTSCGTRRMPTLVLFEIDADDVDPWGGEPVLRDGEYVGYLTSAGYGHCAGRTLALGYVRAEAVASNAAYDVEVIGEPRPARRLERPPVDPEGRRARG